MSVIITGGAGFVGLNIAERLLDRGEKVVLCDLNEPPPWASDRLGATGRGQLTIEIGDVRERSDFDRIISRNSVTRFIHGAAITADIHREKKDSRSIAEVNLLGTIEALEAALRHGIGRFVQLSTGSIYGTNGTSRALLDEEADLPCPESIYGITKYAAERSALRYRETRGLNLTVVRLGMVFGRYEYDTGRRDTLSLPLQILEHAEGSGEAVLPVGSGGDWVYATDVADGVIAVLNASRSGRLYHLSSGHWWSAADWATRLASRFPEFRWRVSSSPAEISVARNAPSPRSPFNIERLGRDLGFAPRFNVEIALEDLVTWRAAMKEAE